MLPAARSPIPSSSLKGKWIMHTFEKLNRSVSKPASIFVQSKCCDGCPTSFRNKMFGCHLAVNQNRRRSWLVSGDEFARHALLSSSVWKELLHSQTGSRQNVDERSCSILSAEGLTWRQTHHKMCHSAALSLWTMNKIDILVENRIKKM